MAHPETNADQPKVDGDVFDIEFKELTNYIRRP